jgi:hypothetical protein
MYKLILILCFHSYCIPKEASDEPTLIIIGSSIKTKQERQKLDIPSNDPHKMQNPKSGKVKT